MSIQYLTIDTVYHTPNGTEVRIEQDHDAECPADWDSNIEVFPYREANLRRSSFSDEPSHDALRAFQYYWDHGSDAEESAELANRYMRVFHGPQSNDDIVHVHSWAGYSQSDWMDYAYVGPLHESAFNEYLSGDVFVLSVGDDSLGSVFESDLSDVLADGFGIDMADLTEAGPVCHACGRY